MLPKVDVPLTKLTLWPQWVASIGGIMVMFLLGLTSGWTSPYLAKLTAEDSPIPMTMDEASWVASLLNIGRLLGAIIVTISVEYIGSKKSLLATGILFVLCWIFLIVADSVIWLYAARVSGGICIGMASGCFPLYLGEISSPSIRGALVSVAFSGASLGIVIGNFMGAHIDTALFAWIALVPNAVLILLCLWLPDSPHNLVRDNKIEDAKRSILWYHREADVKAEVESLKEFVSATSAVSLMDKLREFNIPRNRMAGVTIIMLFMFMQFSGLNSIVFYMEIIMTKGKVTVVLPSTIVVIVGTLGILTGFVSMYFVDKCGRKTILLISSIGVGISMIALGVHFMLLEYDYDSTGLQWLPIVSMILYQISVYFGLIPIPSVVFSELFAPNIKSIAVCIAMVASGGFAFISSKTYQPLVDVIGEPYVFWIYAIIMILVSVPYVVFVMPETKGKSLQEIQDLLIKNSIVKSKDKTCQNDA